MTKYAFPYAVRLHTKKEFNSVFQNRISYGNGFFTIYLQEKKIPSITRIGIIVSRKLGDAVKRNKIKRRIREIFRINRGRLKENIDLIIVVKIKAMELSYPKIQEVIFQLWDKADIWKKIL